MAVWTDLGVCECCGDEPYPYYPYYPYGNNTGSQCCQVPQTTIYITPSITSTNPNLNNYVTILGGPSFPLVWDAVNQRWEGSFQVAMSGNTCDTVSVNFDTLMTATINVRLEVKQFPNCFVFSYQQVNSDNTYTDGSVLNPNCSGVVNTLPLPPAPTEETPFDYYCQSAFTAWPNTTYPLNETSDDSIFAHYLPSGAYSCGPFYWDSTSITPYGITIWGSDFNDPSPVCFSTPFAGGLLVNRMVDMKFIIST